MPLAPAKAALCERRVQGLMPEGASTREVMNIAEIWWN